MMAVSDLPIAGQALDRFLDELEEDSLVLDIGYGSGQHSQVLREYGMNVVGVDYAKEGDYLEYQLPKSAYDGIWCSHVLEHIHDVGRFLQKAHSELKEGGVLAVTVPPAKHDVVGGHVSIWNEGLLLYRLILAGFDCSAAKVGSYGYNLSVIVRKRSIQLPELKHDCGDIELLSQYFPFEAKHGFNGQTGNINW